MFQVQLHPSILPADFDITPTGELVLNLPNVNQGYQNGFEPETTTADGNGSAIVTGSADILNGQGPAQQPALDNAAFHKAVSFIHIYVTERKSSFGIEDCFALNCTLN